MTGPRWLLLLALALLALQAPCTVSAQPQLDEEEEELAYAVARVSYNEAGNSQPDLQMIWAITESRSSTMVGRLRWLRCHSPRVLRPGPTDCRRAPVKVCREGRNCWWTRNLRRDGVQPEGWPHSDAFWRGIHRRRWLVHLERAQWVVSGHKARNACPGGVVPDSWGGEGDIPRNVARGWSYYRCGDTTNYGFSRPHHDA